MLRISNCSICITPEACIAAAAMLLIIPFPWALAWILAVIWHELFHCFALMLCHKHIQEIIIGGNGAEIKTGSLSDMEVLFCALAGPFGGFTLLLLSGLFPQLTVCGFLQSIFNILPLYPLDGGRALQGFAGLILPDRGAKMLCNVVGNLFLVLLFAFAVIWMFILKLGFMPLLLAVCLVVYTKKIKTPCK